ncbi:MAG: hypothetical protein RSF67_02950, partial [Clostridia bacterium]
SSLLEQQKIAKFFSLLDKQIELWETKLKLNEQFIKIFINSLKLNNRIKFSNICEIFKNINGKSIEQYFSVSDGQDLNCYKVISIGNYSEDFKYVDDKCRIDKKYRSSFTPQICIKNDLCLVLNDKTSKCNILGKCILVDSDDSYVINQRSMILRNENNDFYFFYFQSYFFRNQIKKMAQIGNQSYINSSQLLNIKIPDINLELTKMFIYKNKTISILKEKMILKISLLIKRKQYFINKIFI